MLIEFDLNIRHLAKSGWVPGGISDGRSVTITKEQARRIEFHMGLDKGALDSGFKIRRIENIQCLAPRAPTIGNEKFKGAGNNLPGGHPEMVVDSILTDGDTNVKETIEGRVK